MAIVEMSKIKLIGLNSDKQNILNVLHKTGSVELRATEEIADTFRLPENTVKSEFTLKHDRVVKAIDFISSVLVKDKDSDKEFIKNFFVSYDEFMSISSKEKEVIKTVEDVENYTKILADNKSLKIKYQNLLNQLLPYSGIDEKFSFFQDTKEVQVFMGTVKNDGLYALKEKIKDFSFTDAFELSKKELSVILVVSANEESLEVSKILGECGFNKCPFFSDCTPNEEILKTQNEIKNLEIRDNEILNSVKNLSKKLKTLKVYADYCKFLIDKFVAEENFENTESTFVLNGYFPKDREEEIKSAINGVSSAVFMEISVPDKNDNPPTLTKNGKLVSQTEFVTDMYSAPDYREKDPNRVVFFFFMLFMGLIMADIGYGVIMTVLGLILASKIKVNNGTKKLWNVIAIGGVFTVVFGILFNSLFGFSVLPVNILPSPVPSGHGNDDLMTVLLLCLLLGVIQIAVGYFMKALNNFKNKDIVGGILDGLIWVLFFVGFIFAVFNFILDYLMSETFVMDKSLRTVFDSLKMPGIYILLISLFIAVITAGRKEKGFGKFTKGFGALYGLISIMSDILSYARLFGLMLSGMIIAQTFNDIGTGIMASGGIAYVFGALVMILGHAFNIAMGVLGAYIHDSRLQYIEFFGKFYTGEGNKFTPFGSETKYIYLVK